MAPVPKQAGAIPNKLDGVTATVNLATETASVTFLAAMPADELITAVAQAGYTAALPAAAEPSLEEKDAAADTASLLRRLLVSLALAIPVVALAMVPAWQSRYWQ